MTEARRPPIVIRGLVRAFPRAFRDLYGKELAEDAAVRVAEARRLGLWSAASVWIRLAFDLTRAGLAERRQSSVAAAPVTMPTGRARPMMGWTHDVAYAWRRLRREPLYAAFVALTLALGIGANVAVFSVLDGVLWRALPYDRADRLVAVWGRFLPESGFDFPQFSLSPPEYFDYRAENATMAGVGAWSGATMTVGGPGENPERLSGAIATPSLFTVLRARPRLGRLIEDRDPPAADPASVVLLSHAIWVSRFGGRDDVVGRRLTINGVSREVIGVMPQGFDFPAGAKLWMPLVVTSSQQNQRQSHGLSAVARLADGASIDAARREMDVLMAGWRERYPNIHTGHFLYLNPLLEDIVGNVEPVLKVVAAATSLLLLIVCANVASLALARAERRARESAIRTALGAGRWRLVRLAAIENGLLALSGGVVGVAIAAVAVSWLRGVEGTGVPRVATIAIDLRVWTFAAAASLVAACLLGALPALRSTAARIAPSLRLDTRTAAGGGRTWLRRSLVAAEVALAIVLVTGSALLVRSFTRLLAVDTGFRTEGVLLGTVALPPASYPNQASIETFLTTAIERLRSMPGVTHASLATNVPVAGTLGVWDFRIEGRPVPGPGQPAWNAAPTFVAPGFFEALRMTMARGRAFTAGDRADSEPVAVISEAFERKFFGGESAIDQRIAVCCNPRNAQARVVGVVRDIRDQDLATEPRPMYFMVYAQTPVTIQTSMRQISFILRGDGDPTSLASPLRNVVRDLDAALPVSPIRTFDEALARTLAQRRFTALLLAIFAAFGLGLGMLGVYGVLAYTVAERTQELGLRRALGAPSGRVLALVLGQGLGPVAAGLAGGLALSFAARSLIESQVYGISPTDPATYAITTATVLAAAILACLAPVRRALRVSPLVAIREP